MKRLLPLSSILTKSFSSTETRAIEISSIHPSCTWSVDPKRRSTPGTLRLYTGTYIQYPQSVIFLASVSPVALSHPPRSSINYRHQPNQTGAHRNLQLARYTTVRSICTVQGSPLSRSTVLSLTSLTCHRDIPRQPGIPPPIGFVRNSDGTHRTSTTLCDLTLYATSSFVRQPSPLQYTRTYFDRDRLGGISYIHDPVGTSVITPINLPALATARLSHKAIPHPTKTILQPPTFSSFYRTRVPYSTPFLPPLSYRVRPDTCRQGRKRVWIICCVFFPRFVLGPTTCPARKDKEKPQKSPPSLRAYCASISTRHLLPTYDARPVHF